MMRKYKVSNKEFQEVFPNRTLKLREKHMQTFWFIDCGSHYELHQKVSLLCLILSPLFYLAVSIPVFIFRGCFGVSDMIRYFVPYAIGKPIRSDMCYHGAESTERLIKLAGWE